MCDESQGAFGEAVPDLTSVGCTLWQVRIHVVGAAPARCGAEVQGYHSTPDSCGKTYPSKWGD